MERIRASIEVPVEIIWVPNQKRRQKLHQRPEGCLEVNSSYCLAQGLDTDEAWSKELLLTSLYFLSAVHSFFCSLILDIADFSCSMQ